MSTKISKYMIYPLKIQSLPYYLLHALALYCWLVAAASLPKINPFRDHH